MGAPHQCCALSQVAGSALHNDASLLHEEPRFAIVDINGSLAGNEFWAPAKEVEGWHTVLESG